MKTFIYILSIFLLSSTVDGQQIENISERSIISLDRNLYVAGETIHFSAMLVNKQIKDTVLSKIIYVELITPSGKQVKGQKYSLVDDKAWGLIQIPEATLSGNYYLRAYTRYMRNLGPQEYSYAYLKIVNPENQDLLNGSREEDKKEAKLIDIPDTENYFNIKLAKDSFKNRDQVEIELKKTVTVAFKNISVAVVPESAVINKKVEFIENENARLLFYPEVKGVTLSGIARNKVSRQPISNHKVNLSILDKNNNIFYPVLTDSLGRFFFSLPDFYESKDVFVSVNSDKTQETEILIDSDFCRKKINLPRPDFLLTKEEQKIAYKLAINRAVRERFQGTSSETDITQNEIVKKDTVPFYGRSNRTLKIDNYIKLSLIEDYFKELPYPVKLLNKDDERKIIVLGKQPELHIYSPLVMVDYVPVYNHESILKLNPEKVDRIDLVTEPYVRGEVTYGGIVNVVSVKNDFAGIDLPKSGLFLNYQFLTKISESDFSETSVEIPDARNTLYWNPDFKLNSKSDGGEIVFSTADTKNTYLIKVEAITSDGKKYNSLKRIVVE